MVHMARRKKHQKLPNGFGSIKYLGKGRYKPYGVYPPVEEYTRTGPVTPKTLAYVETRDEGYEILAARKMELEGKIKVNRGIYIDRTPTFAEVYENFYKEKYMQELIVSLMHQMYKYAMKYDIVDKDYSAALFIPIPDDDQNGVPFNDDELKLLWANKDDSIIEMVLIMCYSGFRIAAFLNMEVNLENRYFKGGVKTVSIKDRIVPIHSCIYDMVKNVTRSMRMTVNERWSPPFGADITNAKYGHRTLEELRVQIEKIKPPLES